MCIQDAGPWACSCGCIFTQSIVTRFTRCEIDYIDCDISLLPNSRNRLQLVNGSWSNPWCFCATTIELLGQVLEQIEQRGWQSMKWKVGWDFLKFYFLSCRRDLRNVLFWFVLCLCRGGRSEGSHLNQLCASLKLLARMISPCFIGLPIMAKRTLRTFCQWTVTRRSWWVACQCDNCGSQDLCLYLLSQQANPMDKDSKVQLWKSKNLGSHLAFQRVDCVVMLKAC